ncbi:MAG: CrcB family protein [Bdellovibrionota bacterium]
MEWLFISLGGAVGATLRYGVYTLTIPIAGSYLATVIVNVSGSFIAGLLYPTFAQHMPLRAFFAVGVLGAFTTFSTFSVDVIRLIEAKKIMHLLLYWGSNVILAVLFCGLGYYLSRR